jgi:arginyl-tRNA synthetase
LNVLRTLQENLHQSFRKNYPNLCDRDLERVVVEPCRDSAHGEVATNAALVLSKSLKKKSIELISEFIPLILKHPYVDSISHQNGFINMILKPTVWGDFLRVLFEDPCIALEKNCKKINRTVHVELVSANPTGPLHAGHGRNGVLGDVIASLFERFGHEVIREYYVNDAGGQIQSLAQSVWLRYRECCGESIQESDWTCDMYHGEYVLRIAQEIYARDQDDWIRQNSGAYLNPFQEFSMQFILAQIRQDLQSLGVHVDRFTSEKEVIKTGNLDKAIEQLTLQGDVEIGTLEPPKGYPIEDWEERPQLLFRSTRYGDDVDRPLQKSDGSWTYFAGDIGYHQFKISQQHSHLVTILGADHAGYIPRLQAVMNALSPDTPFTIPVCQLVNFFDNGKPVRMSKRSGHFIALEEVIERVGKDATRFMMVIRHPSVHLDFDFAKVLEQSHENPLFYIQYAHARICSVLKHGEKLGLQPRWPLETPLWTCEELALIRLMADWTRQLGASFKTLEPHRIIHYLLNLSAQFHSLWNLGKDCVELRFIDPDRPKETESKLVLLMGVRYIIQDGFQICGLTPLDELR